MEASRFIPTPILREPRQARCTRFALSDALGAPLDVMVRDISSRGLSAAALLEAPAPDEIVRARLGDGSEVWGLVRWRNGKLFGVEFDTGPRQRHSFSSGVRSYS